MATAPDGRPALNLWTPFDRPAAPSNWAEIARLFVDHVVWLFGEHADQFLDWLAHLEQKPGELPHFGWLHVSKIHGKGRGWLASVLVNVWSGYVAGSFDLLGALNSSFNDRLSCCILAIVDEINEGGNSSYRHAQTLRQMMTAQHREINIKFGRKHVEHNAARWLIFSNHVGALPLDADDRRFFIVDHDGPVREAEYYTALYSLLDNPEFTASVAELLRQRDISGFNPGKIPPVTKAKQALIDMTKTEAETILAEIAERWPADVITWYEISELMDEHVPKGPAVKYMTDRAGLVKLSCRLRAPKFGANPTTVYSIRNHDVWTPASIGSVRQELSRVGTFAKEQAFFGEGEVSAEGG